MSSISTDNPAANSVTAKGILATLLSQAGLADLRSRAKIVLTGSDRVRWLNGMMTNNVRDLSQGHGVYGFLLNPQGRILGDLYAYNRGESLFLDTDQSQVSKILELFDHYIIMDDVEVSNISDKVTALGIVGAKSRELMQSAGIAVPELEPLQIVDLTWSQSGISVVRGDNPLVENYEVWVAPANFDALWNKLLEAGGVQLTEEMLEKFRVASGVPKYGVDIRERDLPQETEQARALNFNKGCYIGQEIVERIRSRGAVHRSFTGFRVQGPLPSPGTKIEADGKESGEITSAAILPFAEGEQAVALGYIRREHASKELKAGKATLTVTGLPFRAILKH